CHVIEDDHAIVETEAEVRNVAIVYGCVREFLDITNRVVARVADGAATESRQARQLRSAKLRDHLFEHFERVGRFRFHPLAVTIAGARGGAVCFELAEWPRAEEAIAADAFAANDAFEEERPVAFLNLAEGRDRREGVAGELAIDRNHSVVPGQRGE